MEETVRKSPAPFYAVAVVWLVYALLFPLYKPLHYVLLGAASVVVFLVVNRLCRSGPIGQEKKAEETKKAEAPKEDSTGDPALDKMLKDGRLAIAEMKRLDYYLPTTLKLLNAYDRMSAAGVSGENIDTTLAKVEGMMRTIVSAFEKQLDALYGADALDISTDITVLENMMAREGLVGDQLKAETTPKNDPDIKLEL